MVKKCPGDEVEVTDGRGSQTTHGAMCLNIGPWVREKHSEFNRTKQGAVCHSSGSVTEEHTAT